MFRAMRQYCRGEVLDVGGFDFFLTAVRKGVPFEKWTTLEPTTGTMPDIEDARFQVVTGDGCNMVEFGDGKFDTVLSIQVVEHVFEPNRMVAEMGRVLRPGGHAILLIPQTSTLHMAPHHYYNFTRYWIEEALRRAGLEQLELQALGGRWSSTASHLVYFFLQSTRSPGTTIPEEARPRAFYLLYPLMVAVALVGIPVCLLLSLGDLIEEPNNHLVVARKK
jgi:SAM-dependent methyltransferase